MLRFGHVLWDVLHHFQQVRAASHQHLFSTLAGNYQDTTRTAVLQMKE